MVDASTTLAKWLAKRRITLYSVQKLLWSIVRFCLLAGLGFIILYPFLAKISSMFMSVDDLHDPIVWFVPRKPTLDNIRNVIEYGHYWEALQNTAIVSVVCALLQTASATLTAYGLARFHFRGRSLLFGLAVLTIVIPPQTIYLSLFTKFRFFDFLGLLRVAGISTPNLTETIVPMLLLSFTALGLKNGLYILILTQLFRNLPKELSEAACVDGAGMFRTFWSVNLPQVRSMMVSVFLLSFAWQWTDTFYSGLFFRQVPVLPNVISSVRVINEIGAVDNNEISATMVNTAVILVILPLVLVYLVGQRFLIQGVERSGMVG